MPHRFRVLSPRAVLPLGSALLGAALLGLFWARTSTADPDTLVVTPAPPPAPPIIESVPPGGTHRGSDGTWWPVPMFVSGASLRSGESSSALEPPVLLADVGLRHGHTLVFDPVRQRFLLFGGTKLPNNVYFNDVWERPLGGTAEWTLLSVAGTQPPGRWGHSAVYDPIGDRMLVYGGQNSAYLGDVWELGLAGTPAWSAIVPFLAPPTVRAGHTSVFDATRNRIIAFGGHNTGAFLNDTWFLNLGGADPVWVQASISGTSLPATRYGHVAVLDAARDRLVIYGGIGTQYYSDVWSLSLGSTQTWTRRSIAATPGNRDAASAVLDAAGDRFLVFGGRQPASIHDQNLWAFNLGTLAWTLVSPAGNPPGIRRHAAMAIDPVSRRAILQGGVEGALSTLSDTWSLDLEGTPVWTRLLPSSPPPPPVPIIDSFSPAYGLVGSVVTITGSYFANANAVTFGSFPVRVPSDFTVVSGSEIWATVPSGASRGRIQVTTPGGTAASANDFFVITPPPPPPPPPPPIIASFTPASGPVGTGVTITGSNFAGASAVTFNLVSSGFSVISTAEIAAVVPTGATTGRIRVTTPNGTGTSAVDFIVPPPIVPNAGAQRYGAGGDFDANRGRHLVVGGAVLYPSGNPIFLNDAHALRIGADSTWVRIEYSGIPMSARLGPSAVYDPIRDRLLIFGGYDGNYLSDLHELRFAPSPTMQPLAVPGGPHPRDFHAAVYDAFRDRMLIFGGNFGGSAFGDLWELTLGGTPAWRLLDAGNPSTPKRMLAGMVIDPFADRLVLFGGWAPGSRNDLWQYPLSGPGGWTPIAVTGELPGPRHSFSFRLDALGQRAILHSGKHDETQSLYSGTWEFSLVGPPQWRLLASGGGPPIPRYGHLGVVDPVGNRMLVSGGYSSGSMLSDLWRLQWNTDQPTPAVMSLRVDAVTGDAVELIGHVGIAADGACRVERSPDGTEWSARAEVFPDVSGAVRFVDRQVVRGEVLYYRLAMEVEGAWVRSEEIRVQLPGTSHFALHGFSPNPSNGEVRVSFRLTESEPVTIELIDVSGRRVASRRVEAPAIGEGSVGFAGERLSPGFYFVRLTQGHRSAVRRGVVAP